MKNISGSFSPWESWRARRLLTTGATPAAGSTLTGAGGFGGGTFEGAPTDELVADETPIQIDALEKILNGD